MAISTRLGGGEGRRHQPSLLQRHQGRWRNNRFPKLKFSGSRKSFRYIIIILAFIALLPPIFFHFKLRRLHQTQLKKCGWLNDPPLVCAHGGDSINAFPNTMAAYHLALRSKVDCLEIDVSRSKDGVLFALHDRDLQRISGNSSSKVGHLSMKEIKELAVHHQSAQDFHNHTVPTIEDALMLVSSSVRQVILDAKVGPPSYEKGLAKDILAVVHLDLPRIPLTRSNHENYLKPPIWVERLQCQNCLIWAKSDNLARDVIKLRSNVTVHLALRSTRAYLAFGNRSPTWWPTGVKIHKILKGKNQGGHVGYIVMVDPDTGIKTKLLRMKGAGVVGVHHPLIDEKLVAILHRRNKKAYAWTVDDADSMQKMLFEHVDAVVTNNPNLLQQLMQDIRTECREEGFSLPRR
ncbi:glycerophosphodiester phosphodiesterase GDPD4 [Populus alba x Populus x berolinensis]|nr:glycerophosphodiester phosphodiesterase GDPD4 [Populus alba x Populus x berolinensis]